MGAWGHGSFENDDALDWVNSLAGATSWSAAEQALAAMVGDGASELEAPECSIALAACETLAAALGRPASAAPPEVAAFVARVGRPPEALAPLARQAIDAIRRESELRDLWDESEDADAWRESLEDLKIRLAAR